MRKAVSRWGALASVASVLAGPAKAQELVQLSLLDAGAGLQQALDALPKEFQRSGAYDVNFHALTTYCGEAPNLHDDCKPQGDVGMARMELTEQRMTELREAQALNYACTQSEDLLVMPDGEVVTDYWHNFLGAFKQGRPCRADCEDFALSKRAYLMEKQWPSSTVLMTYAIYKNAQGLDEGHMVLTVRTTKGDFVLDNTVPAWQVMSAQRASQHLKVVARQSQTDPMVWDAVTGPVPMELGIGDILAGASPDSEEPGAGEWITSVSRAASSR